MSENVNCLICDSNAIKYTDGRDGNSFNCERCGRYFISGTVLLILRCEDVKPLLPKISCWISEQHEIFNIKSPEILTHTIYLITETEVYENQLKLIMPRTDFDNDGMFDNEYSVEFLSTTLFVSLKHSDYDNDIFKECKTMIDIFCLQELYQIALRLSLDEDGDVDMRIGNYIYMLQELDIDFKLMIALAGKDFFLSDFYDETEEDNDINILKYLIYDNYDKVVRFLQRDFNSKQELLEFIIKDFNIYDTYNDLKYNNPSIVEFTDSPEVIRLYNWGDDGFCIS